MPVRLPSALRGYYNGQLEEQIFTADHCLDSAARTWRTGRWYENPVLGTSIGTGISDIAKIRGKDYNPYMYIGTPDSNTITAVRGAWSPVIGAYVHYSGAPSGTVYGNEITHLNVTVDYGGGDSYRSLVRTVQVDGQPAAGNGDSGGPVFAVNSQSQALATGIISGMSNAALDCSGDPAIPGERECSDTIFFAPLSAYFASNPLDFVQTAS